MPSTAAGHAISQVRVVGRSSPAASRPPSPLASRELAPRVSSGTTKRPTARPQHSRPPGRRLFFEARATLTRSPAPLLDQCDVDGAPRCRRRWADGIVGRLAGPKVESSARKDPSALSDRRATPSAKVPAQGRASFYHGWRRLRCHPERLDVRRGRASRPRERLLETHPNTRPPPSAEACVVSPASKTSKTRVPGPSPSACGAQHRVRQLGKYTTLRPWRGPADAAWCRGPWQVPVPGHRGR